MAGTVTFILKNPKAKEETPIFLVYWYDQLRIKVSTGEKTHPDNWNPITYKARKTLKNPQGASINTRLKDQKQLVEDIAREHLNRNNTIFKDKLQQEIREAIRPKPKEDPKKMTLFKAIREYIDLTNKALKTKVSYEMTLNTLKTYSDTLKKELTFENINMDFYNEFVKFLTYTIQYKRKTKTGEGKTVKTGYDANTIGNRIKNIKVFMNYALDKGYTENRGHLHKNFKKIEETAETIYLTDAELETLYNKDFTGNAKLDRVRDLFIIGCYTGLRFSDLSQLTPDKFIKGGTQIKIKTKKTGETVNIPLHWTIKEILQKYEGVPPRAISNQKMNEYLKDICEDAKINERITLTKKVAGLTHEHTFEKWQLITVHTARRSFATNMYLAEVPTISIMKITGHRTEKAFMKYIKITQEQNANKLSTHPYFAKSPLKAVN
ncbi:MAG: tyrosine-type recombinase/integrase [Bacteroidetes bacterium]|nr:tyrosine-type recombinase/integrase [Bacteroidota bacterium]